MKNNDLKDLCISFADVLIIPGGAVYFANSLREDDNERLFRGDRSDELKRRDHPIMKRFLYGSMECIDFVKVYAWYEAIL